MNRLIACIKAFIREWKRQSVVHARRHLSGPMKEVVWRKSPQRSSRPSVSLAPP